MTKETTTVLVSRKWNSPNIEITVTNAEIGIKMALADFVDALAREAGNPTWLVTIKGLEKRLAKAAELVVAGMKDETAKVM